MKTLFINPKSPEGRSSNVSEAVQKYKAWEENANFKTGKENKLMNNELRKEAIREIADNFGVSSELMIKILIPKELTK